MTAFAQMNPKRRSADLRLMGERWLSAIKHVTAYP